jgi:hypothetical protein
MVRSLTREAYQLASLGVPQLARLVKRPRHDLVAERVVIRYGVDHVLMALQGVDLGAGVRVPDLRM